MAVDREPGLADTALLGVVSHRDAQLPGVRLHLVEALPPGAREAERGKLPLIILLHGFPEAWFSWRHQIPALAAAGYRVLAPDMRGFNLSEKPRGVDAYRIEHLVNDVAELVRWAGAPRARVAGHDWGAIVAWHFAMRQPDLLDRLAILNGPHPAAMASGVRRPAQMVRSSYALFFQLPWLPERVFLARNAALLRRVLAGEPARPGAFTEADIAHYVAAVKQPRALTGGMNYYRAAFRQARQHAQQEVISAPVLVIWGMEDRYLGEELANPPRRLVPNARVERLPGASHWVQNDEPGRVNELLVEFFGQK